MQINRFDINDEMFIIFSDGLALPSIICENNLGMVVFEILNYQLLDISGHVVGSFLDISEDTNEGWIFRSVSNSIEIITYENNIFDASQQIIKALLDVECMA